ncbi:MAG: DUF819 family protein [Candidatus Omnitrophica bacterium]|nr:DUF819 family protein [Candidatus Omnitrophota bacterium]
MIHNTYLIILILLAIESTVVCAADHPRSQRFFKFLPSVFWIYFLPMLASTFGFIDPKNGVYQTISNNFLPASLILLLLSSDIKSVMKLEKPALIMMFAGAAGIMLGMPLVFFFVKQWTGIEFWSGFGALSASWIGGSANMIAVKEAIGTPESVFTPMVIVDTIVPYVWMGILISIAGLQKKYDHWNKSDESILGSLSAGTQSNEDNSTGNSERSKTFTLKTAFLILFIAISGTLASKAISYSLPNIKNVITPYTWVIIISSLLGIFLSFTPARSLERSGSSKIGYFILYFVLTSIGARANISNIGATVILIIAGFFVVLFHAAVLFITSRIIKAPLFLIAAASQANIGGVASAPVVAAIYQPKLASIGLLLAILGNIIGTYLGIITSQLCRFVAGY